MLKNKEYTQEELQAILGDLYIDTTKPLNTTSKKTYINAINSFINANPCNILVPENERIKSYIFSYKFKDYIKKYNLKVYYVAFFSTKIANSLINDSKTIHICLKPNGEKVLIMETYDRWGHRGNIRELGEWCELKTLRIIYTSFVLNAVTHPSFLRQIKEIRSALLSSNTTYLQKDNAVIKVVKPHINLAKWEMNATIESVSLTTLRAVHSSQSFSNVNGFTMLAQWWNQFEVISEAQALEILTNAKAKALDKIIDKFHKTTVNVDVFMESDAK